MNILIIASSAYSEQFAKKLINAAVGRDRVSFVSLSHSRLFGRPLTKKFYESDLAKKLGKSDAVFIIVDAELYSQTKLYHALDNINNLVETNKIMVVSKDGSDFPTNISFFHDYNWNDRYDYHHEFNSDILHKVAAFLFNISENDRFASTKKRLFKKTSKEDKNNKRIIYIVGWAFGILIGAIAAILLSGISLPINANAPSIVILSGLVVGFVIVFFLIKRKTKKDRSLKNAYQQYLQSKISDDETDSSITAAQFRDPDLDAIERMRANLVAIEEYYTWSQEQARHSFKLAIWTCIGGFILLIAAVVLPIIFKLSIELSLIPTIGGAIAELVAATSLFVYRSSLTQLNHYHQALHEDERFLSSVNLINRFSTPELQDVMLREIIRSEIAMNLAGIGIKSKNNKD